MYILFQNLSDRDKGLVLIATGLVLLLHTFGIIQRGLDYVIIGGAAYMMWCGFLKIGGLEKVQSLFKKRNNETE